MALTTDTTLNFTSSAGYAFDAAKTEFVAGVARLKSSAGTANDTIITPDVDRTGFTDSGSGILIHKMIPTLTEVVGYFHKFLVSFDQGRTFKAFNSGGYNVAELADIATRGFGPIELENIRTWEDTDTIRLAIYVERLSGGGNGDIDLLTIHFGTTVTSLDGSITPDAWPADPDHAGRLMDPDRAWRRRVIFPTSYVRTGMGYNDAASHASNPREVWELNWSAMSEAQRDVIEPFLREHQMDHITWQPNSEPSAILFTADEPSQTEVAPNATGWTLRCRLHRVYTEEHPAF